MAKKKKADGDSEKKSSTINELIEQQRSNSLKMAIAEREQLIIKKAKLNDGTCHVEFKTMLNDKPCPGSLDPGNQVHEDLTASFKQLVAHIVLLGELAEQDDEESFEDFLQSDLLKSYGVTGFSIGGSGDNEGVALIGYKLLSNGKQLNLVSPFQKWNTESDPYPYIDDLSQAIELCKHEVIEYLNGKVAPNPQPELEFEKEEQPAEE